MGMVTPGAQSGTKADPDTIAAYTLGALRRVVPPVVPGIMFLSGGQSEIEATLNLNAMNQSPNPWHISFSYARALQNTTLKTWAGKDENKVLAQAKLIQRAQANSKAQLGKCGREHICQGLCLLSIARLAEQCKQEVCKALCG